MIREELWTAGVVAQLDVDWPRFVVVPFGEDQARHAGHLADAHNLRGGDAVHLASFAELVSRSDDEVRFSSADDRLSKAARALG